MDGILNSIKSFFSPKKKDEQLMLPVPKLGPFRTTPTLPTQMLSNPVANKVFDTVSAPLAQVGKSPAFTKILDAIASQSATVPGQAIKNIAPAFSGPTIGDAGNFAKTIAQSIPQALVRTETSLRGKDEYQPKTAMQRTLLGDEPVKSFKKQGEDISKAIGVPAAVGIGLSVGGTALDLLPPTSGKSKAAIKSADDLAQVLKNRLKIKAIDLGTDAPITKAFSEVADTIRKEYAVDKKVWQQLNGGGVIEGNQYIIQRQGDNVVFRIGKEFDVKPVEKLAKSKTIPLKITTKGRPVGKNVVPEIKPVEIAPPVTKEFDVKGVELAPKVKGKTSLTKLATNVKTATIEKINEINKASAGQEDAAPKIDNLIGGMIDAAKGNMDALRGLRAAVNQMFQGASSGADFKQAYAESMRYVDDGQPYYVSLKDNLDMLDELIGDAKTTGSKMATARAQRFAEKQRVLNTSNFEGDIPVPEFQPSDKMAIDPVTNMIAGKGQPRTRVQFNQIDKEADQALYGKYKIGSVKEEGTFSKPTVTSFNKMSKEAQAHWDSEEEFTKVSLKLAEQGIVTPPEVFQAMGQWKYRAMPLYQIETAIRNVEELLPPEAAKAINEGFIFKVRDGVTAVENFVAKYHNMIADEVIDGLGIKPANFWQRNGWDSAPSEDVLTMRFGEGRLIEDKAKEGLSTEQIRLLNEQALVAAVGQERASAIMKADDFFRAQYDDILNQINETMARFGYDPVLRRNDYYTHFQIIENGIANLADLGNMSRLPAYINGITATFKPGKKFFRFGQKRLGDLEFEETAIGAFEKYLYPAAYQIHLTEPIQRGRLFATDMRGFAKTNPAINPKSLGNFLAWFDTYVNMVAGKKSGAAREFELYGGRFVYDLATWMRKRTSLNLVVGNVTSALSNFIPLTQSLATTSKGASTRAIINMLSQPMSETNKYSIDGIQSQFLRRRIPSQANFATVSDNIQQTGIWLFQTMDKIASNLIVGGKYYEGLEKNLTPQQAMKQADDYAARLMGDRSIGQMPNLFGDQGPIGAFVQFQLEVNNQLSFLLKDVPKMNQGSVAKTTGALLQVAIYSYIANTAFEWITGRRPAIDPLYTAWFMQNEIQSDRTAEEKTVRIGKQIMQQFPFISTLFGGARIPMMSGLDQIPTFFEKPQDTIADVFLTYVMPVGGSQVKKTVEGISIWTQGYAETDKDRVKYPVDQGIPNLLRGAIAGQYAFPEAQDYFREGDQSLGEEQSAYFKQLPVDERAAYYEMEQASRELNSFANDIGERLAKAEITQDEALNLISQKQAELGFADGGKYDGMETAFPGAPGQMASPDNLIAPPPPAPLNKMPMMFGKGGIASKGSVKSGVKAKISKPPVGKGIKINVSLGNGQRKPAKIKPIDLTPPRRNSKQLASPAKREFVLRKNRARLV